MMLTGEGTWFQRDDGRLKPTVPQPLLKRSINQQTQPLVAFYQRCRTSMARPVQARLEGIGSVDQESRSQGEDASASLSLCLAGAEYPRR